MTDDSSAPRKTPPASIPLLKLWLYALAIFLLMSSFAFLAFPNEQVDRLLAYSRFQQNAKPCPLLCSKEVGSKPVFGVWRPFWCPTRCGGEYEDVSLATHLMKALGATYGTLALLAFVLANASPLLRVIGAQCFAAWSLAQLATSSASLLSPADAANRVAFHGALVVANTLCSAYAVMREC